MQSEGKARKRLIKWARQIPLDVVREGLFDERGEPIYLAVRTIDHFGVPDVAVMERAAVGGLWSDGGEPLEFLTMCSDEQAAADAALSLARLYYLENLGLVFTREELLPQPTHDDMSTPDWPFDQAPNVAAITLQRILDGSSAILHVTHDKDDHGWQFLDGEPVTPEDAAIVGMGEVVRLDPSVRDVADLPPGWIAWRESIDAEWQREPHPDSDPNA